MARRKPRRDARGRFLKAGGSRKRSTTRRRRVSTTRKRRPAVAVAVANPRRRTYRRRSAPKRRSYRRNPKILGMSYEKNTLKAVGYTVVGVAGTPFLEGFIQSTVIKTFGVQDPTIQKVLNYGIKIGSAFGISYGAKMIGGRDAGRYALVGGLAYCAVAAIRDIFPTLLGTGTMGKYLNAQPMLGKYQTMRSPQLGSAITRQTPARLSPATRM